MVQGSDLDLSDDQGGRPLGDPVHHSDLEDGLFKSRGTEAAVGRCRAGITEQQEQDDAPSTPSHADGLSRRHPLAVGAQRQSRRFLADHVVQLDPDHPRLQGLPDLSTYLDYYQPIHPPAKQLAELGAWIGEKVFGGLREAFGAAGAAGGGGAGGRAPGRAGPAFRPFELARFADGTSFREAGVRFVYGLEGTSAGRKPRSRWRRRLRILAAFSLPVRANPLNLRRERYGLQRLVRDLNQTQGLAVELRVLQYGATRDTLKEALEEAEGWDIIHLSGHGQKGELLLEDDRGGSDTIDAEELGELLDLARARLKLLILDACYSGVGSQAAAREQVGLDGRPFARRGPRERRWPRPPRRPCPASPRRCRSGWTVPSSPCATRSATPSPPS